MKTTIPTSPEALAWRKRIGADLWDEVLLREVGASTPFAIL
jgi:hypothetical protein